MKKPSDFPRQLFPPDNAGLSYPRRIGDPPIILRSRTPAEIVANLDVTSTSKDFIDYGVSSTADLNSIETGANPVKKVTSTTTSAALIETTSMSTTATAIMSKESPEKNLRKMSPNQEGATSTQPETTQSESVTVSVTQPSLEELEELITESARSGDPSPTSSAPLDPEEASGDLSGSEIIDQVYTILEAEPEVNENANATTSRTINEDVPTSPPQLSKNADNQVQTSYPTEWTIIKFVEIDDEAFRRDSNVQDGSGGSLLEEEARGPRPVTEFFRVPSIENEEGSTPVVQELTEGIYVSLLDGPSDMDEDDAGMSSGMNPDDFVVTEEYLLSTQSNYRTRPVPATAASLPKSSTTTRATSTSSTTTTTSKMETSKATTVKTSATPAQDPLILPTQRGPVTSNTVEAQPINDFSNVLNILVPALIALIIAVSILKVTEIVCRMKEQKSKKQFHQQNQRALDSAERERLLYEKNQTSQ